MTKQELINFINKHKDKIGAFHIALDERFEGQFTLGYYYDDKSRKYKVYEVNERQCIWIRDEFKNENDAIERLFRLIKTTFWIKETPILFDDSEIDWLETGIYFSLGILIWRGKGVLPNESNKSKWFYHNRRKWELYNVLDDRRFSR